MNFKADQPIRQEVIVWLYSSKKIKSLQKFGYIYYVSSKMKYAVMYIDQASMEDILPRVEKLHFVRSVEASPRQTINMSFDEVLPNLQAEYDKVSN